MASCLSMTCGTPPTCTSRGWCSNSPKITALNTPTTRCTKAWENYAGFYAMINPNKLGRSPFPRWQAQWMMAGKISTTPPGGGLADGDPVTTWLDSSVNGNNATQTGALRPTFKTNILNGKPVV